MTSQLEARTSDTLHYLVSRTEHARQALSVLCFLHGYDEAAPRPLRTALTIHGPLSESASRIARERFIVVAPQLPVAGDLWHQHADEVVRIVQSIRDEMGTPVSRVYLCGFSFGGNGVFDLAAQHPGVWSALWAVDPTRVPTDTGHPVWLSVGSIARRRLDAFTSALRLRAPEDATTRVILDEGEDHVGAAKRAFADPRIYEWLLAVSSTDG